MYLIRGFPKASTGRQLIIIFFCSSFLVFSLMLILSLATSKWLEDIIVSHLEQFNISFFSTLLYNIGKEKSEYIELELQNFIEYAEYLNKLNINLLTIKPQFKFVTTPNHLSVPIGEILNNTGCYMTRKSKLSESGQAIIKKDAAMDMIYPAIFRDVALGIYSGFLADEILHYYPCSQLTEIDYTPIVREWFYKAMKQYPQIVFTEPYVDIQMKKWVITVSKAIVTPTGEKIGVNAVDITFDYLTSDIKKTKIMNTGFAILVSAGGMLINIPTIWNSTSEQTFRIYQQNITGISESQWGILKETDPHSIQNFTTIDGVNYYANVHKLAPFKNQSIVPHYLMLCISQQEVKQSDFDFFNLWTEIKYDIGIYVVVITVFMYSVIIVIFIAFERRFSKELISFSRTVKSIVMKALRLKVIRGYKTNSESDEIFINAFIGLKDRLNDIALKEQKPNSFEWEETRPRDDFLFSEWMQKVFPFNLYDQEQMRWRKVLAELNLKG